ncbi:hypothetical protein GALMADRAFT_703564 [Galerina marginata CBS 339.88]|uniref:Uncharacterized protein n=1 Tax=Galerina marginata (strain CBS 339.88) TaxID=685588 RepID=A0A067TLY0_GALM3|nr:hypothetical protein GALMADRAFT_703564 [Galerina marginata CBS 339.88]
MIERYSDPPDSQPFFLAQDILSRKGVFEKQLDTALQALTAEVDKEANDVLAKSRQLTYYQKWKPAKDHKFPTNLPHLPEGSEEILAQWQNLSPKASAAYLTKLAIESNRIEGAFLLAEESAEDLIRRGITEGAMIC